MAAAPEKDLKKLEAEQAKEDDDFLDSLAKESKEFDKVSYAATTYSLVHAPLTYPQDSEIERIRSAFRANAYDVLDLQPGVPDEDIKKTYRKKSLLIHPDKSSNPLAPDAFDRLAIAYQALLDEKKRAKLDEAIADARMLLIRDRGLTTDSEEVKDPDVEFMRAWKEKVKFVLADNEARRQRQLKAQMQEEGRQQRKEEEELEARKRKREHEVDWERTRDTRINSWREFSRKPGADGGGGKKKKKMKTLG
ncbi:J domain-containing protein spf31 [Teratosphaeria destructans]|uniref:J domain-containing protein spf31 n=1 Tax=Teratosphaeria destructans TaxID=418781 RepID=A0A9W7W2J9_9PEZI|nr:J domain-containing protein spf31 [Teratosphaeria destructans]